MAFVIDKAELKPRHRRRRQLAQSNPNHRQQSRPLSHFSMRLPANPKRRLCGTSSRGLNDRNSVCGDESSVSPSNPSKSFR